MISFTNDSLDLGQIAASGQCFRMSKIGDGRFSIISDDRYISACQDGNEIFLDCTSEEFESYWKSYFDLDTDYAGFISSVDASDVYLTDAASFGKGIRILRQDLWEMIVSFLISQQNNITRIRRCINNISEKYGEKKAASDGTAYYAFPKPEAFAHLEEDALMECNLGYRSKYVVRTAKMVNSGAFDLDIVRGLDYENARKKLMELYGVGAKVADCICLFALHKLEAFPIDTHIKQVLNTQYPKGFPFDRYKGYEGVIQQYIFYYDLRGK